MDRKNFPSLILQTIRSFLSNRYVTYGTLHRTVVKQLSKGCPQGSVLGPLLWNLVLDSFLSADLRADCQSFAYADDVATVVGGDTRRALEETAAACMSVLINSKLKPSPDKTCYMVFGAPLGRDHTLVRLHGRPVRRVEEARYLGITLDTKLSFMRHVEVAVGKVKRTFLMLRRLVSLNWDLPQNSILTIYQRAVIPIFSYGLPIWNHHLFLVRVVRKLKEAQGLCLRCVLRAYRTVPVEALCVLARVPPLHLEMARQQALAQLRATGNATFLDVHVSVQAQQGMAGAPRRRDSILKGTWQREWDESLKARHLHRLISDIGNWLEYGAPKLAPRVVELFTGHGEFGVHLHRIGKSPSPNCAICLTPDDPIHRITACPRFDGLRQEITVQLGDVPNSPTELPQYILQRPRLFYAYGERTTNNR